MTSAFPALAFPGRVRGLGRLRGVGGPIAVFLLLLLPLLSFGQAVSDENTIVIESAPDMEIFSFGKTVVVKQQAKGVLVFGADIIVEGRVEGDAATIGGSIVQRENAFVGGDVIVLGGKYSPDSVRPMRADNKQTIIFAAYEEELRRAAQDPAWLFAPDFSFAFLAQRLVSILFWFLISIGVATVAPGAVSRAVSRLKLSPTKVIAVGFFTFFGFAIVLIAGMTLLPSYINAVLAVMAFVVLTLAYVFGRVALHVSCGKFIQKHLFAQGSRSEALSTFFGVLAWTALLSLPYLWAVALLALFAAGSGLVLTARPAAIWKTR